MTTKLNSFMGISSGSNLVQASSGGTSGDAFDVVSPDNTTAMVVNTAADLTNAHDRGLQVAVSASANSYVQWNVTSATVGWGRFYFRTTDNTPVATLRLVRGYASGTPKWDVRLVTTGEIVLTNDTGAFRDQSPSPLAANTIYRCEFKIAADSSFEMRLYLGDSTTPESLTNTSGTSYGGGNWDNIRFGCQFTASQTYSGLDIAGVAWSDTDWIGPATSSNGVADYQLTENYAANSDTSSNLVVDGTGSTGTVTLVQTSGTTASVSESPTGVFTITNPTGTDNLVFELTATSDTADMVEFTWTRGGGVTNPIYASEFVKQSDNSWSPTIV